MGEGANHSIAMRRILNIEKRDRKTISVRIEKELYEIIKNNGFHLSDLVNIALEKHLKEKGFL